MNVKVKRTVKNVNHIKLNHHLKFVIFVNSNKYQLDSTLSELTRSRYSGSQ
jgi:hypothetical protein